MDKVLIFKAGSSVLVALAALTAAGYNLRRANTVRLTKKLEKKLEAKV